jgi:YVTN family beta-propeller protein
MSFRRWGRLAAMVLPTLLCVSCGQVYRPVVIPCAEGGIPGCPPVTPPAPANFHAVFGISANVPGDTGGALQIDVAGDAIIAETPSSDSQFGDNPTHAAILPGNSRVYVASAGSVIPGGVDVVSSFAPAFQSGSSGGFGPVSAISLPAGSQPVFLNTTQSNAMYVANFGTNSVSALSTSSNAVNQTASVGVHPVALAETPNGLKLYVANQGDNSVSSLNTAALSSNVVTGFSGMTPVWIVARGDSQKVYVLTQGDGQLVTIDTATDTVTSSLPVGVGANFILYDPHLNRLYVTNPSTNIVYVFSDTGGANDTPVQLTTIPFNLGSAPCLTGPSNCQPASVTALPDGSRFYVASYQTALSSCPDNLAGSTSCVIPGLSVFDANSFALRTPTLTLLTYPPFAADFTTNQYQYAVPPVTTCIPPAVYTPGATRFRVFTTAAADSSRVYVSMCDAGAIAVINTTDNNSNNTGGTGIPADTLVCDLPTPFSLGPPQSNGQPANQSPIFLLTGQ